MKKTLLATILCAIFIGSTNLSSQALLQNSEERGSISVNTNASTEIAPDTAEISFTVKTSDEISMQKAAAMNKEISDKLYSELKTMLNTAQGDFIKTSDYNATPIYAYTDNKRHLTGYEVSNRVIVQTKALQSIGTMIDKATHVGAAEVHNLVFSVSNYETQCNELIGIATQKAYTRADIIAKNLSEELDGIKSFTTTCGANNYNTPRMYMAKNLMSSVTEDSTAGAYQAPISEGVIKINANVNASFFVK